MTSLRIHFIGIDGISMSALAAIMQQNGHTISGSDLKSSPLTQRLVDNGALFFKGQKEEHIALTNPDMVVYTAAIKDTNPELQAARRLEIPVLERAEFLGQLTRKYAKSIAVAGSHGKTTTTAMLATVLVKTHADPTALVGGELSDIAGNVHIGNSDILLTEACEYVESFLHLNPHIGVILNVDRDHLDYFENFSHIISAFKSFAHKISPSGSLVINADDPHTSEIITDLSCNVITFGLHHDCDWYAKDISFAMGGSEFTACYRGEFDLNVKLQVPGEHNIYNALAVIATCHMLELDLNAIITAIADYKGTHRRFEKRGILNDALLVDDYAHHPKEISTTLQAARSFNPDRLIVVFQPHTYTRTRTLLADFAGSFVVADKVIVTHTYAAREAYDPSADSHVLARAISECHPDVTFIRTYQDVADYLKLILQPGDLLVTMGAGPVDRVIDLLLGDQNN